MFRQRAYELLSDIENVISHHSIVLGPFLEIGAGSVHRSAALLNKYSVDGVATDISQKSLQDAPYILKLLDYDKSPLLISCDAHAIPFLPNTFQFVFAYQMLHHFGNPIPIVEEVTRVLGKDGHFYFNQEPMDSGFRRFLRKDRWISDPPTLAQKLGIRLGVDRIFWDKWSPEPELGMIEAKYDIDLWRSTLSSLEILDIEVNGKMKIHSDLRSPRFNAWLSGLVGGNIMGLCIKRTGEIATGNFRERLMCVDCHEAHLDLKANEYLKCDHCGRIYPINDGVIRMLPKELEIELFPESAQAG
jgi:SAM-dependent methyltransferase